MKGLKGDRGKRHWIRAKSRLTKDLESSTKLVADGTETMRFRFSHSPELDASDKHSPETEFTQGRSL